MDREMAWSDAAIAIPDGWYRYAQCYYAIVYEKYDNCIESK